MILSSHTNPLNRTTVIFSKKWGLVTSVSCLASFNAKTWRDTLRVTGAKPLVQQQGNTVTFASLLFVTLCRNYYKLELTKSKQFRELFLVAECC